MSRIKELKKLQKSWLEQHKISWEKVIGPLSFSFQYTRIFENTKFSYEKKYVNVCLFFLNNIYATGQKFKTVARFSFLNCMDIYHYQLLHESCQFNMLSR